jgi:hypothetical protein
MKGAVKLEAGKRTVIVPTVVNIAILDQRSGISGSIML